MNAASPDIAAEFRAARERVALFDRPDRALLIATGRDRREWLHNLVTNAVRTLADGTGCYAFACDVRGRIQFDLNILARPDALWLDVDAGFSAAALRHLERYLLSEDVRLSDATAAHGRLAASGPESAAIAARLGVPDLAALAPLSQRDVCVSSDPGAARGPMTTVPGEPAAESIRGILVRHDFAGALGFELIVPADQHAAWFAWLAEQPNACCAGRSTLEALRIDAGIPALGCDLDATVVAPESGQAERAISYHKGCYLGQEVIERMRSHGALARRMARLEAAERGGADALGAPPLPSTLLDGDTEVGRLTSLVCHPLEQRWIGLGLVRTRVSADATLTAGDLALRIRRPPDAARSELS